MKNKLMIATVMMIALAGCSPKTNTAVQTTQSSRDTQTTETSTTNGGKALVLYFDQGLNSEGAGDSDTDAVTGASLAGGIPNGITENDIRVMSDEIVKVTGADAYAVRVNEVYAPVYENMVNQAQRDQRDNKQFTFKNELPDLSQYDVIFVGTPVWWTHLPQPMVNVFDQLDFSGKTIYPFGIHLGSRFGNMVNQMK